MSDKRTGRRPKFERKTEKTVKSLEDLFQVFYDAKVAEGVSKRTLETYRENFRFLCDYLDMNQVLHSVANVNAELLRRYQTWMLTTKLRFQGHEHKSEREKTVGLSPVTVNTRTKTLRCMFRFWKAEGLIDSDPWESRFNTLKLELSNLILFFSQICFCTLELYRFTALQQAAEPAPNSMPLGIV